jgi:hypothetical protein
MKGNTKWMDIKSPQKNKLFIEYVENELKKNKEKYENDIINNLVYIKNNFFLQTLKKDKAKYKNLENDEVIIKNNSIEEINNIKVNDEGLMYFIDNKFKQLKITDYKNKFRKINNTLTTKNKPHNYKLDYDENPVFIIQ